LVEVEGKEEGTMSSREDQAQKESAVNGAAEEAESRIFALDPEKARRGGGWAG
jgi:hypothetical protein